MKKLINILSTILDTGRTVTELLNAAQVLQDRKTQQCGDFLGNEKFYGDRSIEQEKKQLAWEIEHGCHEGVKFDIDAWEKEFDSLHAKRLAEGLQGPEDSDYWNLETLKCFALSNALCSAKRGDLDESKHGWPYETAEEEKARIEKESKPKDHK